MSVSLTQDDANLLRGHAEVLRMEGKSDMPAAFDRLALTIERHIAAGQQGEVVAWRSQCPGDTRWLLTEHEPTVPEIVKAPLSVATPRPPKPAADVPLPELHDGADVMGRAVCLRDDVEAYGDAREAAARCTPIPMLLWCPRCHAQHIDAPDNRTEGWENPPHRSHLCHACGCIWRPSDVATVGVAAIESRGKADTFDAAREAAANSPMRDAIRVMAQALANGEWAEHALDADPDVSALEGEITKLIGLAAGRAAGGVAEGRAFVPHRELTDVEIDAFADHFGWCDEDKAHPEEREEVRRQWQAFLGIMASPAQHPPAEAVDEEDETRTMAVQILALSRRPRRAQSAPPQKMTTQGEAQDDTAARSLYNKWTDSHDKIHCNRFPAWSELDEEDRAEWRDKALRATGADHA